MNKTFNLLGILRRKCIGRENALKQHSGVVVIIEVDEKIQIVFDKPHSVLVPLETQLEDIAGNFLVFGRKVLHQCSTHVHI